MELQVRRRVHLLSPDHDNSLDVGGVLVKAIEQTGGAFDGRVNHEARISFDE